jgi:ABC-type glycerol-3-phosphate transport system permease component
MKLHRAVTLAVMILASLLLIGSMTAYGIATFSGGGLVALVVVLVLAAVAGIGFSWRRYFPGRR